MQTLKKLAVAYRLSLTHGYCHADLEEAKELAEEEVEIPLGFLKQELLDDYGGNSTHEIAGMLVDRILDKEVKF